MKYKISEVAAMMGISAQTLRFYEQYGLRQPTRDTENNYRNYSDPNVDILMSLRKLRNCGCTVRRCVDVLNCPMGGDLTSMLDKRKRELTREIEQREMLVQALQSMIDDIDDIARFKTQTRRCMSPEMYGSVFITGKREDIGIDDLRAMGKWTKWMPLIRWMSMFEPEDFDLDDAYPRMGYAMHGDVRERIGLSKDKRLFPMPSRSCLLAGVTWDSSRKGLFSALKRVYVQEFAQKNRRVAGTVFGVTVWNGINNGEQTSCGKFYFPLE